MITILDRNANFGNPFFARHIEKIEKRKNAQWLHEPMAIYEVHLGSWQRDEHGNFLNYRELAEQLTQLVPVLVLELTAIRYRVHLPHQLEQGAQRSGCVQVVIQRLTEFLPGITVGRTVEVALNELQISVS